LSGRSTSHPIEHPWPEFSLRTWHSERLRRWVAAPFAAVALAVLGLGLTASPLFSVDTVVVTGAARLSAPRIIHEAGLDRPANVYWFRSGGAKRTLEGDPWIAAATITRDLPHTIRIHLVERRATSRVRVGSTWLLVAGDGTVLGPGGRDRHLPTLPATAALTLGRAGPGLLDVATVAGRLPRWLSARVRSVLPQAGGGVVLELASGGRVLFGPPTDLDAKVQALSGIIRWGAHHHRRFDYVDLRAPLAPAARLVLPLQS
jgi:cell division protein FtsQ